MAIKVTFVSIGFSRGGVCFDVIYDTRVDFEWGEWRSLGRFDPVGLTCLWFERDTRGVPGWAIATAVALGAWNGAGDF